MVLEYLADLTTDRRNASSRYLREIALAESGQFPPVALRLIASGEKSGRLDTMLDAAALHESNEVQTRIRALTAVLGPVVILAVGALVLLIVLAILLPIFELNSLIK